MAHDNEYKNPQINPEKGGTENISQHTAAEQTEHSEGGAEGQNTEMTSEQANDIQSSAVDATLGRRAENYSSGATHNDTGIFPQP